MILFECIKIESILIIICKTRKKRNINEFYIKIYIFAVLLSTLSAQFPRACGLKFRNPESRAWRGVRLADGKLFQPVDTGWANIIFVCVTPKGGECKFSFSFLGIQTFLKFPAFHKFLEQLLSITKIFYDWDSQKKIIYYQNVVILVNPYSI